ncbi:MAG TPA: hypothetical protein VGJ48_13125 [Pyrinomonadaceae bacterium]
MKSNVKTVNPRKAYWRSQNNPRTKRQNTDHRASLLSKIISCSALNSFSVLIALLCYIAILAFALVTAPTAHASDPTAGTITPGSTPLSWHGMAIGGGALNAPLVLAGEDLCEEGVTCDTFYLTLSGTPADWVGKQVHVTISWLSPTTDYDLYVHKDSLDGPEVASSGRGATSPTGPLTQEDVDLDPDNPDQGTGVYAVHVVYYAATAADQYTGTATVVNKAVPSPTPTPSPTVTPTPSTEPAPRFSTYAAPGGLGNDAGEPTVGINFKNNNVMYLAGKQTLRAVFDDSSSPAQVAWSDKSYLTTSINTNDPILFTDSKTGRTFVSQLVVGTKQSLSAYTDDDGDTWKPSQGSGINTGVDHQTIGGGPFGSTASPIGPYQHAVYYAAQDIALAEFAMSLDGGQTYGPGVPMYNLTQCGGIHGHIKVASDGTIYVPNASCFSEERGQDEQGVAVSEDNGLTWAIRTVPGSHISSWDPSVSAGEDGTIYFGYADADQTPRVAVSHDKGVTWVNDQPVNGAFAIKTMAFPAIVAGDSDRAAYAFLATTDAGIAMGSGTSFRGTWHLFVATTYDSGGSWVTTDVTPTDPVQRGNLCDAGLSCPSDPIDTRNLLDFMDVQIDNKGRILVAYADGCTSPDCIAGVDRTGPSGTPDGRVDSFDNDGASKATIARQSGAKPLFRAFDPPIPSAPAAPQLIAGTNGQSAFLTWSTPDDGGSVITGYKVYRGVGTGTEALLASVGPDTNSYTDAANGSNLFYRVSAVNAVGEGARSVKVTPAVLESACRLPGITVGVDELDNAPNTPLVPQVDLRRLYVAEPYSGGANKLVFTLQLASGGALPPNSQWYIIWNRLTPDANHDRNYLAAKSDALGNLTFEHGRVSYPLVYLDPQPNQGNIPTRFGAAEGSYDPVKGIITISVTNDKVDNVSANQQLLSMEARSFLGRNDGLPINQNTSSDFATAASYTFVGNESCNLPPAAPTNLTATSQQTGQPRGEITLGWSDNSNDETSFSIERSTSLNSGFVEVVTVGANTVTYTDRNLARKTTYYYRVRALKGTAKSGYSNIAGARTK